MNSDPLIRIADALERIADALEPSPEGEWGNFFDQVERIANQLGENCPDGVLGSISASLGDISTTLGGGQPDKASIADSLEDIATIARRSV
jgi:ABC-type transporter Mla subunit MlaD